MWKRLNQLIFGPFGKTPVPVVAPTTEPALGPAEFDVEGLRLVGIERLSGGSYFRYLVPDAEGIKREMTTSLTCSLEDHARFLRRFQAKMARAEVRFQEREGGHRPC